MIGKSLANDFQYTKLKDKQYLYFSLNIPCFFNFCFFLFSLFSSPCSYLFTLTSLNFIHFYLMYYQDNSTQHHKVISFLHANRNFQVLLKKIRKQNKQKYCYFLKLKGCAHNSLLEDITHYCLNF